MGVEEHEGLAEVAVVQVKRYQPESMVPALYIELLSVVKTKKAPSNGHVTKYNKWLFAVKSVLWKVETRCGKPEKNFEEVQHLPYPKF